MASSYAWRTNLAKAVDLAYATEAESQYPEFETSSAAKAISPQKLQKLPTTSYVVGADGDSHHDSSNQLVLQKNGSYQVTLQLSNEEQSVTIESEDGQDFYLGSESWLNYLPLEQEYVCVNKKNRWSKGGLHCV